MSEAIYRLTVTPPAERAIRSRLPESVAWAVIESCTGPLLSNPSRVGKPLRAELTGIWSARRGTYRVLYHIDQAAREVVVLRVEHRADIYRPR